MPTRRAVNPRRVYPLIVAVCWALTACSSGSSTSSVSGGVSTRYTISGVITAAVNSAVDGDTNDPLAPLTDNSDINNPQSIPNPVVLGGYANVASCGDSGVSTLKGDAHDYYRVSLQAGQTITLFIAQAGTGTFPCGINNLDLYLYRYDEAKFVGWTVFLFTWGSLDVKPDRLLVAFDPNGVVTQVAYRHEAPSAEFDVWP